MIQVVSGKEEIFNNEYVARISKVVCFITFIFSVVILWDIKGLGASLTTDYIASKVFFIFTPLVLVFILPYLKKLKSLAHTVMILIFFMYCYYYTVNLHYSYYTSFLQFIFGIVFFFRFRVFEFLFIYISAGALVLMALSELENSLPPLEFASKSSDIMGALLPMYALSFYVYFVVRKKEMDNETKDFFFKKIGENVGFVLHEIKTPLSQSKNSPLQDIFYIANILWPGKKQEIIKTEFNLKDLVQDVHVEFSEVLETLNIQVKINVDKKIISSYPIVRLIFKNLFKNAVEECIACPNIATIRVDDRGGLRVVNTRSEKKRINGKKLTIPGYTTKHNISNKGIGLYIVDQLCAKILSSLEIKIDSSEFSATVKL